MKKRKILVSCTDLMTIQFMIPHLKYLVSQGFDVELMCSNVGERIDDIRNVLSGEYEIPIRIVSLKRNPLSPMNIKGYFEAKKVIKSNDFDLISTNEPVMGLVTRLAAKRVKSRAKVVYTVHGFHFYQGAPEPTASVFKFIEKNAAKITDSIVTINYEDYDVAKSFIAQNKDLKVFHINGIGYNSSKFRTFTDEERINRREELGFKQDDILMMCVGELNSNKNQEVLIKGLPQIIKKYPKVKLILAGKGDNRGQLDELVKSLNLDDHVMFLGYRKDLHTIIPVCDVGVSASLREGLPLNLLEEMACGLPLLASVNRGHRDVIDGGKTGILFEPASFEDFSKKAIEMLDNFEKWREVGKHNLVEVQKYDVENVKTELLKIYEDILKQ